MYPINMLLGSLLILVERVESVSLVLTSLMQRKLVLFEDYCFVTLDLYYW